MGMYHRLKVGDMIINSIDWEMTPELTFGTFESWGGRERVRNNSERIYYFFVDNWGDQPKLCLMERGVKHAKIIAEIQAPLEMMHDCVKNQGEVAFFERSFAIDESIQQWLINNVLDDGDANLIYPVREKPHVEDMGPKLAEWDGNPFSEDAVILPSEARVLMDDEVDEAIKKWDFFDTDRNPTGNFFNHLHAGRGKTIVDQRTGLMWQSSGLDITSMRSMNRNIAELNKKGSEGFNDWRLPSIEEAMSLMRPTVNHKGDYLDPNFSKEQPFIFVAAPRKPGGYWFVDYRQGRAFWSSGTIPGGFGRLCRSLK